MCVDACVHVCDAGQGWMQSFKWVMKKWQQQYGLWKFFLWDFAGVGVGLDARYKIGGLDSIGSVM